MTPLEEIEQAIGTLERLRKGWRVDGRNQLFVTLHRTIDAQLAILRDFADRYTGRVADDWEPVAPAAKNALSLARAINGAE